MSEIFHKITNNRIALLIRDLFSFFEDLLIDLLRKNLEISKTDSKSFEQLCEIFRNQNEQSKANGEIEAIILRNLEKLANHDEPILDDYFRMRLIEIAESLEKKLDRKENRVVKKSTPYRRRWKILKLINSVIAKGALMPEFEWTLTNRIHLELLKFKKKNHNDKFFIEFFDEVIDSLLNIKNKTNRDLIHDLKTMFHGYEEDGNAEINEFIAKIKKIFNGVLDDDLEKNRAKEQNKTLHNLRLRDFMKITKEEISAPLPLMMRRIRLHENAHSMKNDYKKIWMMKEAIIPENNGKSLLGGVVNRAKLEEVKKKFPVKRMRLLIRLMQYIQNLYNNYKFTSHNEKFIAESLKIYNPSVYYEIKSIEPIKKNKDQESDIELIEFVCGAKEISDKDIIDDKSFVESFVFAFVLGVSDRINSGNLLKKINCDGKNIAFNIDFGQLFDFQHDSTVNSFANHLAKGEISMAKNIFLRTWEAELIKKIFVRKSSSAGVPFFKLFREVKSPASDELSKFQHIYYRLVRSIDAMDDKTFQSLFDVFASRDNLDKQIKLWNDFYEESGKNQINSSGIEIRYNVGIGVFRIYKALNMQKNNNAEIEQSIKGNHIYYKDSMPILKFLLYLLLEIMIFIIMLATEMKSIEFPLLVVGLLYIAHLMISAFKEEGMVTTNFYEKQIEFFDCETIDPFSYLQQIV